MLLHPVRLSCLGRRLGVRCRTGSSRNRFPRLKRRTQASSVRGATLKSESRTLCRSEYRVIDKSRLRTSATLHPFCRIKTENCEHGSAQKHGVAHHYSEYSARCGIDVLV